MTTMTPGAGEAGAVSLTDPGRQRDPVGTAVTLTITATDETGAARTYAATHLPAGLAIDPTSGAITGTTTTVGTSQVTVTASDPDGAQASATFDWQVTSGN